MVSTLTWGSCVLSVSACCLIILFEKPRTFMWRKHQEVGATIGRDIWRRFDMRMMTVQWQKLSFYLRITLPLPLSPVIWVTLPGNYSCDKHPRCHTWKAPEGLKYLFGVIHSDTSKDLPRSSCPWCNGVLSWNLPQWTPYETTCWFLIRPHAHNMVDRQNGEEAGTTLSSSL